MATIENFNYNPETETLKIVFGYDTTVEYIYSNVPAIVAEGLKNAESKGKYFHSNIRPFDKAFQPTWKNIS